MGRWLSVARRVVLAVLAVYLILSLTWAAVALTPDPNEAQLRYAGAVDDQTSENETESALQAYREARGYDRPLLVRYRTWLVDMTTFDWGVSRSQTMAGPDGDPVPMPVTMALARAIPNTLRYVLPALALAVGLGVALGTHGALNPDSRTARVGSVLSYFGSGFPNFYLAAFVPVVLAIPLDVLGSGLPRAVGPVSVRGTILPVLVLTLGLLGSQIRYVRTEVLEHVTEDFVRLVRSKGAGEWRVARHVLRNAALPLLALFVTEVLAVLVVDVFVIEYVFGIGGVGSLAYDAIFARDLPLVLGTTTVIVVVGVAGTLLQDLTYQSLDPRVGDD